MVTECILLFIMNLANTNHSSQSFCLWSIKNLRYCSSSWFILSIWPSVWGWNTVENFVSISNIWFNSFVRSTANYSLLSDTTLSGNLCSFHILFLNNCANSSTNIPLVVATKYVILNSLLQTTRTASFPATNSNFIMKSTIRCVYSFSRILLNFNFPVNPSILFFILWHISQPSTYFSTSLVTFSHQ